MIRLIPALMIILLVFIGACVWGKAQSSESMNDHFDGKRFFNPEAEMKHGFGDLLAWNLGLRKDTVTYSFSLPENPPLPLLQTPNLSLIENPPTDSVCITWIGHSTFLIQIGGKNILTDPVFCNRASPVQFAGPKRKLPPALTLEQLPPIDFVLLSHNHYDHLDAATVDYLGNQPHYWLPRGLDAWFKKRGITNVSALDWWENQAEGHFHLYCVPAQHFSSRSLWDRNQTLWCGWVLEYQDFRLYFAGDSGYFSGFREIGRRFQSIDVAFLPIGAYRPRWFMHSVHIDPIEAVQVHQEINASLSVAMHWGTFRLTDEPLGEPPLLLQAELQHRQLPLDAFRAMQPGETIVVPLNPKE